MYQILKTPANKYFWYLPNSDITYAAESTVEQAYSNVNIGNYLPYTTYLDTTLLAETTSLNSLHESHPELFV